MATAENFVGRNYGPTKYVVGLEKVREFATATKNDHPWHHDETAAAEMASSVAAGIDQASGPSVSPS